MGRNRKVIAGTNITIYDVAEYFYMQRNIVKKLLKNGVRMDKVYKLFNDDSPVTMFELAKDACFIALLSCPSKLNSYTSGVF